MIQIFLSYRRDDSAYITGRIADALTAHFGLDTVKKDVDSITPGANVDQTISALIQTSAIVLAIIGPKWRGPLPTGGYRLNDPADPVRREIEQTLQSPIFVIPVLVENAPLPDVMHLPPSLKPLLHYNAIAVRRDPDFHQDVEWLIQAIEHLLDVTDEPQPPSASSRHLFVSRRWLPVMLGAISLLLVASVLILLVSMSALSRNHMTEGMSPPPERTATTSNRTSLPSLAASTEIPTAPPVGSIREFPLSLVGSKPEGITSGPGGNLWFTLNAANAIGQMSPAGTLLHEFPIPTPNSNAIAITYGPDGNLWFTGANANQIGRITPSGQVREFSIPTINSNPLAITGRPDGPLWFTEGAANQIGRIQA